MTQGSETRRRKQKNTHPLSGKILFSLIMVSCYLFGKKVMIPWVVQDRNPLPGHGLQALISAAMGNDTAAGSVLAVGFMPYMTSMIVVSLFHSVKGKSTQTSQKRMGNEMRAVTLLAAILQSVMHAFQLTFREYGSFSIPALRAMTVMVLIAGTFYIVWLSERCRKWGIGGSTALILANMVQNIMRNLAQSFTELQREGYSTPAVAAVIVTGVLLIFLIMIVMEGAELHLSVRHLMIHNSFSGDSDLAMKLNPVGTMALMYVMTLFALPYYLCRFWTILFGENPVTARIMKNLNLQNGWGIFIFVMLLIGLNCALARIYINPQETADILLKSGDYLPGVHPGEDTKRAINSRLWLVSVFSSVVLSIMIAGPLILELRLGIHSSIFMLPMSFMVLCGILLNVMEEVRTIQMMNTYRTIHWGL